MTEKKHIADSILFMLTDPIVQLIADRGSDINPVIDDVSDFWKFDLMSRKPGPAYYDENGQFHATNLDLACFLYALLGRKSVINLPDEYKSRRVSSKRADQKITSKSNRHGEITGLQANKEFFSFSVRINDLNVIGEDTVGAPRNFMITDLDGSWYDGWKRIEFVPTIKENSFITENSLWTGNKIYFDNFISPNRWVSFFGRHYIITKLLIERLREEAKHYNAAWKEIRKTGVSFPASDGPAEYKYEPRVKGVRQKFEAFEVKIQHPEFEGDYTALKNVQSDMVFAYRRQKNLTYTVIPKLQFMTRATEYAHFKSPNSFPSWIKNVEWETGYKESSRHKILWERLPLFQYEVGMPAVSILKRTFELSTEVAA